MGSFHLEPDRNAATTHCTIDKNKCLSKHAIQFPCKGADNNEVRIASFHVVLSSEYAGFSRCSRPCLFEALTMTPTEFEDLDWVEIK